MINSNTLTKEQLEKAKILKHLMDTFDKDYLQELFDEGSNAGAFSPLDRQHNYQYMHNGYLYRISRVKIVWNPLKVGG